MLHATSVNDVEDTAKIAGIDLTDKAFWRQGLQSLACLLYTSRCV